MPEQPLVYVVIVNRNLKDDTAECIQSVLRSSYSSLRVVLLDNASSDDSVQYLRSRFPEIDFIGSETNLGYAGANNVGMRHALRQGADYALILNNDTVVDEGLVSELVRIAESDGKLGVIGPIIFYYAEPHRVWYFADRMHRFLPCPRGLEKGKLYDGRFDSALLVDYVSTCAMLIKRQVVEDIGMFEERFFWYYEDPDFCCRARAAGYKVAAVPSAKMWHKVSLTAKKTAPFARYLRARNRLIFYTRHPHGPHPLLTHLYLVVDSFRVAIVDLWRRDLDLLPPLVLGLYDGYRRNWEELRYRP